MKLGVRVPNGFEIEKRWIAGHLLSQLTDDYQVIFEPRADWEIFLVDSLDVISASKSISFPDIFFLNAKENWLKKESLPKLPLLNWEVEIEGHTPMLVSKLVPIIFGKPGYQKDGFENMTFNLDIFGAAFFMLSRYEELVESALDKHGRYLGERSVACRAGFIDRPLIDEYCEILWTAIACTWPEAVRKSLKPKKLISCDLDHPFTPKIGLRQLLLSLRNNFLGPKKVLSIFDDIGIWNLGHKKKSDSNYDAIDWMMSENEKKGNQVTFYFISAKIRTSLDGQFDIREPRMRALLRTIHQRGHEIGLHPSYMSYNNKNQLINEVKILREIMAEEGIEQELVSSRQHYLRWDPTITGIALNDAGIVYDSTLADPFRAGFRCGTCREFTMFDVVSRTVLNVIERPLVLMESSVIARRYMNLGYSDQALSTMKRIKQICYQFGGSFTLLWHNSHLLTDEDKRFYLELI